MNNDLYDYDICMIYLVMCLSPFSLKALWLFLKKYHRLSANLFSEIQKYSEMQEFRNKFRNLFLTVLDSGCQNQSGSMIMFWWVPSAWFTASAFYLYPDLLEGAVELCWNFFHENTNLIHEGSQPKNCWKAPSPNTIIFRELRFQHVNIGRIHTFRSEQAAFNLKFLVCPWSQSEVLGRVESSSTFLTPNHLRINLAE